MKEQVSGGRGRGSERESFFKNLFIHERHTHTHRQRHGQREKQAPCRETDVGLDPRTPGPQPELKADAQPLTTPPPQVSPIQTFYYKTVSVFLRNSEFREHITETILSAEKAVTD